MSDYPIHVRDIRISDPCILAVPSERKYFTYARYFDSAIFPEIERGPYFYGIESEDLIHWSKPFRVFEKKDFWADLDYWAPECHAYQGRYYLISSFRAKGRLRRCQCLVSDSPRGPFVPVAPEPVTPPGWHCLDGTLYIDRGGKPWMVFCHEWLQVYDGQIAAVPLSDDLGKAVGDPIILFRASDAPWAMKAGNSKDGLDTGIVTDGPWLHRTANGVLLMLWSNFSGSGYTTGYAVSQSGEINGPWVQVAEPLFALDGAHSMLFRRFDGTLMMSLHCPNIHSEKRMLFFEMEERGDRLFTVNEITGNWCTTVRGRAERYRYDVSLEDCDIIAKKG